MDTLNILECDGSRYDSECMDVLLSAMASFDTVIAEIIKRKLDHNRGFAAQGRHRLICFSDGAPAGFLDYRQSEVCFLMVRSELQRGGIGSRLLDAFEARTVSPRRLLCFTDNHAALSFYAGHGYEQRRLVRGRFFGESRTNYEMVKA